MVCNYVYNYLYAVLMSLVAHRLEFVARAELIVAYLKIGRLIVVVPFTVAVKLHSARVAL